MTETKPYIKVRDVMTPTVETIQGLAPVSEAIRVMKKKRYGALLVDKRDDSDEYGIITVQDIARNVIAPNLSPDRVHVYEVMTKPVLGVHGDMNIRYAIRLLDRVNHLRALVVENGRAIGIVTMYDMVMSYMDEQDPG